MENVHTVPIDLQGRQSSFKVNALIDLPEEGRMRAEPETISVEFVLEMRSMTESFDNVPVRILSPSQENRSFVVKPQAITIQVRGQQQRIEQVRTADLFAYVDCTKLKESTGYDLPVVVDLPTGLQLIKTEPAVVHVEIGKTAQEFP